MKLPFVCRLDRLIRRNEEHFYMIKHAVVMAFIVWQCYRWAQISPEGFFGVGLALACIVGPAVGIMLVIDDSRAAIQAESDRILDRDTKE